MSVAAAEEFVVRLPRSVRQLRETWKRYHEAELGFRNHWYPLGFGRELFDDRPVARRIAGEPIILRRVEGKVYALEDRCAHRRVPLSKRFECYTKDTVSCWFHGFTYSWKDGKLVTVVTDPENDLVGKLRIKSYPVAEAKGLVFVFIGDIEPPPLADDLPPAFLDEDREVEGRYQVVESNWRMACDNGVDSPHVYIHRNSPFMRYANVNIPLALAPKPGFFERLQFATGPGPKGLIDDLVENYVPIFSADVGEAKGVVKADVRLDAEPLLPVISMWLPCCASVEGFPQRDLHDYEFYVPTDAHHHLYFQLISKRCATREEAERLHQEVERVWTKRALDDFNRDDIVAREGLEDGYLFGDGWVEETLTRSDAALIAWRQFASRYCRGVQKRPGEARVGAEPRV